MTAEFVIGACHQLFQIEASAHTITAAGPYPTTNADFHAANRASSGGALAAGLPDLMTRRGS